nr:MAG TPA: hypothetical protein [Caudoviricetes sp.]
MSTFSNIIKSIYALAVWRNYDYSIVTFYLSSIRSLI